MNRSFCALRNSNCLNQLCHFWNHYKFIQCPFCGKRVPTPETKCPNCGNSLSTGTILEFTECSQILGINGLVITKEGLDQ